MDACVNYIRMVGIVKDVKLYGYLQVPPSPFFVECVIRSFMFNDHYRRQVSLANDSNYLYYLLPLSNRRVNANGRPVSGVNVQLRFLPVPFTNVILRVALYRIGVVGGTLVRLNCDEFHFEHHFAYDKLYVSECAKDDKVFRMDRLVILHRVGMAGHPRDGYLSFYLGGFFQVAVGDGNNIAIVGHFVGRVPNGENSTVIQCYCVVRLVE